VEVRFRWDRAKAVANRRKHRVSFEQAREVFDDPDHVVIENYLEEGGEQRQQIIGLSCGMVLLAVIFVDRSTGEDVVIRLISARKANAYEQYLYETGAAI
jgi:uncharacterized DUF497 family protein